jgi:triacylglycerol lipase
MNRQQPGLKLLLGQGWAWVLDYTYIIRWQLQGLFGRPDPGRYLLPGSEGKDPVVVLPGVYERWPIMGPVIDLVHRLGHPVHVVEPLGFNVGSVPAMAALVADYIRLHDLDNVTIIAHSKGGLIGKYVMTTPEAGGRVNRMVAVCTPFSGSRYAYFAVTPVMRAFSPRNPVLRTLLANLEINHRITSVYGTFDPHIPGGSRLDGAVNIQLDTMGHFRIIGDKALQAAIERILAEEENQ